MLAAIIGSFVDTDGSLALEPSLMLERAAEHMGANDQELIIRIGPETVTPAALRSRLRMVHGWMDVMDNPRLILTDEEYALHGLAGGLDTLLQVYDVQAGDIVTYGQETSPMRARWIVRYPDGAYGACLVEGTPEGQPGPAEDRPREPPPSEPERPEDAQGDGHYTNNMSTTNLSAELLGPSHVGDNPVPGQGLGLLTYNADGLDFHAFSKLLCWLQLGQAGGAYVADARCNGKEKDRWTTAVLAALGPHAKLYMSPISPITRQGKTDERARVGGSIIILNNYWGARAYDWFKDESDLGLVMGVYVKLRY